MKTTHPLIHIICSNQCEALTVGQEDHRKQVWGGKKEISEVINWGYWHRASFDKISLIAGPGTALPHNDSLELAFLDQPRGVWPIDMNQQDVWLGFCE